MSKRDDDEKTAVFIFGAIVFFLVIWLVSNVARENERKKVYREMFPIPAEREYHD